MVVVQVEPMVDLLLLIWLDIQVVLVVAVVHMVVQVDLVRQETN